MLYWNVDSSAEAIKYHTTSFETNTSDSRNGKKGVDIDKIM